MNENAVVENVKIKKVVCIAEDPEIIDLKENYFECADGEKYENSRRKVGCWLFVQIKNRNSAVLIFSLQHNQSKIYMKKILLADTLAT